MLRQLIEAERAEGIDLTNRVTIEVHTALVQDRAATPSSRRLCDELAFWRPTRTLEPRHRDHQRDQPAMATVPGAMLLCASSPYARKGALWESYHRYFGQDGPILVWQAPTRT